MSSPPPGIPEADWLATPASIRTLILVQHQEIQALRQENDELRGQLAALATELASLRERIGRSSRNSSKPPSSDAPGFKPPERRKGSGRKRCGQPGHPGSGPELLPIERVDEVVEQHPDACRHCGTLLHGEDPDPLRHQVIEIPPITPLVIEHRLHRLVCPCCSTSTCAPLPADVDVSRYGPRLSSLIALLSAAFPLSISRSQALLQQVLGVELSRASIVRSLQRVSPALEQPTTAAHRALQQQPVVYVKELLAENRAANLIHRFSTESLPPNADRSLLMKDDGDARAGTRGKQWATFRIKSTNPTTLYHLYSSNQLQLKRSYIYKEALMRHFRQMLPLSPIDFTATLRPRVKTWLKRDKTRINKHQVYLR
jgi:transposase